jgi:two-component sensor histidine kinase
LIINNELVSNTLKYAFLNERDGIIHITLQCKENNGFILIVKDNGIGLPDDFNLKRLKSLGLHLVKILTEQLEGTLEIECNGGTTFCIRFPQDI